MLDKFARIRGRFKKIMANWFKVFGSTTIPLSVVLLLFSDNFTGWRFWGCIVLGFLMFLIGIIALFIGWSVVKQDEIQKNKQMELLTRLVAGIADKAGVDIKEVLRDIKDDNDKKGRKSH